MLLKLMGAKYTSGMIHTRALHFTLFSVARCQHCYYCYHHCVTAYSTLTALQQLLKSRTGCHTGDMSLTTNVYSFICNYAVTCTPSHHYNRLLHEFNGDWYNWGKSNFIIIHIILQVKCSNTLCIAIVLLCITNS
jgi:hypothetical protein